jgi:peptidoglycan hydrolase-like protein with peptidoglycan-binding domain
MNVRAPFILLHLLGVLLAGSLAAGQTPDGPHTPATIVEVQTLLTQHGLNPGPVDGIMGKATTNAIRHYQQRMGLPVDGRITEELLLMLRQPPQDDTLFTAAQLVAIVGPIALYPDELLALLLPASAFALEIVQAARFLEARRTNPALQPDAAWDISVLGLLNYPDVMTMMNNDLTWTQQLGWAVGHQHEDVLTAIQQVRSQAYAAKNLATNTQQIVVREMVQEKEIITIAPAKPDVIYVPRYDPTVVVVQQPAPAIVYSTPYPVYYSPAATFFTGMFVGAAITYGFDWGRRDVRYSYNYNININRPPGWQPPPGRPPGGRPPGIGRPPAGHLPAGRPPSVGHPPGSRPPTAGRPPRPPTERPPGVERPPGSRPPTAGRPPTERPPGVERPPGGRSPLAGRPPAASQLPSAGRGHESAVARPASREQPTSRDRALSSPHDGQKTRVDSQRGARSRTESPGQYPTVRHDTARPAQQPAARATSGALGGRQSGQLTRSQSHRGASSRHGQSRRDG